MLNMKQTHSDFSKVHVNVKHHFMFSSYAVNFFLPHQCSDSLLDCKENCPTQMFRCWSWYIWYHFLFPSLVWCKRCFHCWRGWGCCCWQWAENWMQMKLTLICPLLAAKKQGRFIRSTTKLNKNITLVLGELYHQTWCHYELDDWSILGHVRIYQVFELLSKILGAWCAACVCDPPCLHFLSGQLVHCDQKPGVGYFK